MKLSLAVEKSREPWKDTDKNVRFAEMELLLVKHREKSFDETMNDIGWYLSRNAELLTSILVGGSC